MKRIIRLTESDLTRIVRRVISEESQSTPNVSIESLTFQLIDNNGTDLLVNQTEKPDYKEYASPKSVQLYPKQTVFEIGEEIKLIIDGGLRISNAELTLNQGTKPLRFENSGTKSTVYFTPSDLLKDVNVTETLKNEKIKLTCNVDDAFLVIYISLGDSSVQKKSTNESYRRRNYYR